MSPRVSAQEAKNDMLIGQTSHTEIPPSLSFSSPRPLRYKLPDTFIHVKQSDALTLLERDTARIDEEIERLKQHIDESEEEMKRLKVLLYGKFGNNISEWRARRTRRDRLADVSLARAHNRFGEGLRRHES